ncbi:hypothetical protein OQA88_7549 [Cercophora sp. LCS_1]
MDYLLTSLSLPVTPANHLVLTASLASSIAYALQLNTPPNTTRAFTKTASTALLALLAFLNGAPRLFFYALILSSSGDAFLAWDTDDSFQRGLGSFLAAHVLYIQVFAARHGGVVNAVTHVVTSDDWRAATTGGLSLGMVILVGRLLPKVGQDLKIPVMVYSLAIFIMSVTAMGLAEDKVVVGALMFTASDAILATEKFLVGQGSAAGGLMRYAVWILYYVGQLLITVGARF